MNKTLFRIGLLVVLTMIVSALALAQTTWYVNSTNGDDLINNGKAATQTSPGVGPYKTIKQALTSAAAGDIISVAAGTYNTGENSPDVISKNLTLVSTTFLSSNVVTVTNGLDINASGKTISLGQAANGSLQFNLGTTATALKLTAGTLNIDAANVTVGSGGTITVTAGAINVTPTTTNVNVTYVSTASITAGPELPASLGTGVLTVNLSAGTITIPNSVTSSGGITITAGNAAFSGAITLNSANFTNNGVGNTVTVGGNVSMLGVASTSTSGNITNTNTGSVTFNGTITNDATIGYAPGTITNTNTGTLTCNGSVTWNMYATNFGSNAIDNSNAGAGTMAFNGGVVFQKASTGTANATANIDNAGTGSLTVSSVGETSATISSTSYTPVVSMSNTSTGTITISGGTINGSVNNDAGGTIALGGSTTFSGTTVSNNNAGSIYKLNNFVLTLSGGPTVTNAGKIISSTAGTAGGGTLAITTTAGTALNSGGDLPNVTISKNATIGAATNIYGTLSVTGGTLTISGATVVSSTTTMSGGGLTLSAAFTSTSDYSQSGGTLTFNAQTFTELGNWTATGGTVAYGTGTLSFGSGTTTGANQVFTPLPNLNIYNFTVNNPSQKVTMGASVVIQNNVTLTAGTIDLSTYNIRMDGAGGTFNSGTSGYTSSGGGTLIWEAAGKVTGSGTYSNMDVRTGGATTVQLQSNLTFSGVLYLRTGDVDINGKIFTFSNSLVRPALYKNVNPGAGNGTANIIDVAGGGTIAFATSTVYDLTYYGNANWPAANFAKEWQPANLNSLTIGTGDASGSNNETVTLPAGAVTMTGNLTVNADQTLNLGTNTVTASGVSAAHQITGTVSNGTLTISGNTATVTGASTSAGAAAVNNLSITGKGVAVSNLQAISGTLGVTGAGTVITMNTTSAVITGAVTINTTNATDAVTLTMAATTSTFSNNLTLTNGALTLAMGTASGQYTIAGTATLTAGTLTLGSNLIVGGTTSQVNAALNLATYKFTVQGAYTYSGTTATVSGTGSFVIGYTAAGPTALTLGSALSMPNVVLNCSAAANKVALTTSNLTVTNALTLTMGTFDFNGLSVIVTGNTVTTNVVTAGDVSFLASTNTTNSILNLQGAALIWTSNDAVTTPGSVTINSTGVVTLQSDQETASTPVYRTWTALNLTMTAGNLQINGDALKVTGLFDHSPSTAGNLMMGTGFFYLNTPTAFKVGTGFAVDNLEVDQSVAVSPSTGTYTVNKYLRLVGGTLTTGTGQLTMGNGATIERQLTTAILSAVPTFGTTVNVSYTTAEGSAISTAKELPATVNNFTANRNNGGAAPADDVVLTASVTVNGTVFLKSGRIDQGSKTMTLAAGATINRSGGVFKPTLAPTVSTYNLVYSGSASLTTATEDFQTGLISLTFGTTGGAVVTLNASRTISGPVTLNTAGAGGGVDLAGFSLTLTGDMTVTAGSIKSSTSGSNLKFAGTAQETLTVPSAGFTFPLSSSAKGVTLEFANSSTAGVVLSGGGLTINNTTADPRVSIIKFTQGTFSTGSNVLTLWQDADASNVVYQGYTHAPASGNYSHVVGTVKKFILSSATAAITRVEFPVGTAPTSSVNGYYRPLAVYFKTAPSASFNMMVSHLNSNPGGKNGFPITSGTIKITNYPPFCWYVQSDLSLAPSYQYDMDAQAEGYADYALDGIQNVRFVRRDSGNVSNQWILQQNYSTNTIQYDNSTINGTIPLVKVISATGGITTQGSIFSYSQNNKAPAWTVAPGNLTAKEGDTLTIAFTAQDPDIGDFPTLSAPTLPTGATFTVTSAANANPATATVKWMIPYTIATQTNPTATANFKLAAIDSYGPLEKDTSFTVTVTNVNRPPVFNPKTSAVTIKDTDTLKVALTASDPDTDPLAYSFASISPASTNVPTVTGTTLMWVPAFADVAEDLHDQSAR